MPLLIRLPLNSLPTSKRKSRALFAEKPKPRKIECLERTELRAVILELWNPQILPTPPEGEFSRPQTTQPNTMW